MCCYTNDKICQKFSNVFQEVNVCFLLCCLFCFCNFGSIDKFQINEINVDLRTSGFDNEVLSVDACAV